MKSLFFNRIYFTTLVVILTMMVQGVCQELPPIEVYTPKDYGAENQNWSISQSDNQYIYVGNNKGLLEFNGAQWNLYPSPNETIIRSVYALDDMIFTGCYMEFGVWRRNDVGRLKYDSLSAQLNKALIDDEQFWKIFSIDEYVLFQSLNRIYIYSLKDETFNIIDSEIGITKMYEVDGKVYFQSIGEGLFQIDNGRAVLVSNHLILRDANIINVYNNGGNLLVQTMESGFYVLEGSVIEKWQIPANELLSKVGVYCSIQLHDGSFALGTISKGLIHLTTDGEANYEINQAKGLSNNTVLALFEDQENNIWLGLDNGINSVNITSPYRIYTDDKGTLGTVYASIIYQGNLYIGTNQGLFYKPFLSKESFKFIEGTKGQVWCLKEINNQLFCGHNLGTFIVSGSQVTEISSIDGTWDIKPIPKTNLLLQGNYNGLNVLENRGGEWRFRNRIEGFQNSSKYFELLDEHTVFVSHEYKGVYRIEVDNDYTKALQVEKDSINKGLNSSIVKYQDKILYAYRQGVFSYEKQSNVFRRDSVLSQLFPNNKYTSGKLVVTDDQMLWGFSKKNLSFVAKGKLTNDLEVYHISFPSELRKGMTGYESISSLGDSKYLFGSSTGYTIIDLNNIVEKEYEITINTIKNYKLNESPKLIGSHDNAEFETKSNNFEFTFSIPEFDKFQEPEYQYRLEGFNNEWSAWSNSPSELFENLPFGTYAFKVRGRVGDSLTTNTSEYSFVINRPWYLSTIAIILYVIGFIMLALLTHFIYNRYYKNQQAKLLLETEREMEMKEMASKQQFMKLKNEKLEQDVDNKNRELAISTMSLIKKNEFLHTIKNELKKSKEDKNVKSVIRIIDRNLNNTDDWTFFEEAFNNADKDFLKKMKAKHPALTPNDLKLCAYLRLNLSSKEIAPLLNISPKSVEVKRYRLRKKMDLPHDASLTNYILEI